MKKLENYMIEVNKGFVPRKRKVYSLLREEKGEVCEFIKKTIEKEISKLFQIAIRHSSHKK